MSERQLLPLRDIIVSTYFNSVSTEFLDSEEGQTAIEDILFRRFEISEKFVSWVETAYDLSQATVIEIGCGTGSSSVAFGKRARMLYGYDIDEPSLDVARARASILGLDNVVFSSAMPEDLWSNVKSDHPDGCDAILFFAVLEHLTIKERLEALQNAWGLLKDNGILIVLDTPNRIGLYDFHTSFLPFYDYLPQELALQYYDRSPRRHFVESIDYHIQNNEDVEMKFIRWGRGVSFHEFELALQCDLNAAVIADGFEQEITDHIGYTLEDKVMMSYFLEKELDIPLCFARRSLNFVLQKSNNRSTRTIDRSNRVNEALFVRLSLAEQHIQGLPIEFIMQIASLKKVLEQYTQNLPTEAVRGLASFGQAAEQCAHTLPMEVITELASFEQALNQYMRNLSGESIAQVYSFKKIFKVLCFKIASKRGFRWLYRFRTLMKSLSK